MGRFCRTCGGIGHFIHLHDKYAKAYSTECDECDGTGYIFTAKVTIMSFFKRFTSSDKDLAMDYAKRNLSHKARGVQWVSQDGRVTEIEDMEPTHALHIVAKLKRELEEGKCAYLGTDGQVKFAPLMKELVDDKLAFVGDTGSIRMTE